MANDVLNPIAPTTPTGGTDYEAYRSKIEKTAAATRDIGDTTAPAG